MFVTCVWISCRGFSPEADGSGCPLTSVFLREPHPTLSLQKLTRSMNSLLTIACVDACLLNHVRKDSEALLAINTIIISVVTVSADTLFHV